MAHTSEAMDLDTNLNAASVSTSREGSEAASLHRPPNGNTSGPSDLSSSSYSSSVLPKMSDPTPTSGFGQTPATSEPMVKTNSSGSNGASSKDGPADVGEKASPYGTRSRNRNGTSRPNYAEDKDLDMEIFETYPGRRDEESKKATRQANSSNLHGSTDAPQPVSAASRKPLPSEAKHAAQSKDSQPTTAAAAITTTTTQSQPTSGTASANGPSSQPASKKRKAAPHSNSSTANDSNQSGPSSAVIGAVKRTGPTGQPGRGYAETNLLTFHSCGNRLNKDGKLMADDGTVLGINDHVYLICEPPGEPYYMARIMEFAHIMGDVSKPIDGVRVNWFYRPRDIARNVQDTRTVFATMHSDISPITSLRGKCTIKHKAEIQNIEEYRRNPDCFWFERLYDRYIQKNYEVIPTFQIVNVPEKVKKVLDERWRYILVEQGRGKELTSAVKTCKRCVGYCASNDSVDCAVCRNTYHMNCVRPPLLKKPSRGFAWSCAACSRAQERKLEARLTPNMIDSSVDAHEDDEFPDEEEEDIGNETGRTSPADGAGEAHPPATQEQIYHASLWPYRYLGIHCKVEDALDYDDRIYPRAATRVGPRHQANVLPWPGRPVEYVKPLEIKKSGRKDSKLSKEAQAALEADRIAREKRPKWVQDMPTGYIARGGDYEDGDPDATATLLYKPPEGLMENPALCNEIDSYMRRAVAKAPSLGLPARSTNLHDIAMMLCEVNDYNSEYSLKDIHVIDKSLFREPKLTPAELKKFEEGIAKFGSELYSVTKHVKSVAHGNIVRFYYTWKKTDRGKQIWGNFTGRKGKKEAREAKKAEAAAATKLADDVADEGDDSAFDSKKASDKKRQFTCKYCNTKSSRQWRRAPNTSTSLVTESGGGKNSNKDKNNQYVVALCRRCAELWRRYAVQWEDFEALAQKVAAAGGRMWKKKIDEELLKEITQADEMMRLTVYRSPDPTAVANGSEEAAGASTQEPPRKKLKSGLDKDSEIAASDSGTSGVIHIKRKEKAVEKPLPPPVPEIPKPKALPCAICNQLEPSEDQRLSCRECRLSVHRSCYGVLDNRNPGKWVCDPCSNDKNSHSSFDYKCVLCPHDYTEHDFVEPPKISHKKKTEKEREKERTERESALKKADYFRKRQEEMNRPVNPREPLKRTADNNWVHVTCATWTPEVKFGNAKALEPCEGISSIPRAKYTEVCKICKQTGGACVSCHQCRASVHVECAHHANYLLGFEITPVKSTRRDQSNVVTVNMVTGSMTAGVWCKEHLPVKNMVHRMHDPIDGAGVNALQFYVQHCKQADLNLTGCARKANLIANAAKVSAAPVPTTAPVNRRASLTAAVGAVNGDEKDDTVREDQQHGAKVCLTCGVDVSPRWYSFDNKGLMNGFYEKLGTEAQKFVAQRDTQCHKCHKMGRQPKPHVQEMDQPASPGTDGQARPQHLHVPIAEVMARIPASPPTPLPMIGGIDSRAPPRPPYGWAPSGAAQASHPPLGPPLASPISAGLGGPPPPSNPSLPPNIAPRAPSVAGPSYPPPSITPYGDWHRGPPHHSPPHHLRQVNGGSIHAPPRPMDGPAIPQLAPLNHLRPPPLSNINTQPPPALPALNGHMGQPMMNGMPPSPRRLNAPTPPMTNGGSYPYPSYHHPPPHHSPPPPPHSGGLSSRHDAFTHVLNPPRPPPYPNAHGSPPLSRDGGPMSRELGNPPPPPRPAEQPRVATGASASPSLRNLLS